jgi:DNA-binding NarL/FixJ family response regulator
VISVIIADDHPIVLAGLTQLFRQEADMRVVSTCVNGLEAIDAVRAQRPDVLLLDLNMPKLDGLEVLRRLAAEHSPVNSVVLTAGVESSDVEEARAAGARGIVLKEAPPRQVIDCVRRVHGGESWVEFLGPRVQPARKPPAPPAVALGLTPRELELTELVASGLRNREIAERLSISEGTAKLHLYNVYKKLGVANRVELVLRLRGQTPG